MDTDYVFSVQNDRLVGPAVLYCLASYIDRLMMSFTIDCP